MVTVDVKEALAAMQISWRADKMSQGNRRSYIEALANDMSSTVESFGQNFSRQLYGDGSAALARIATSGIALNTPVAGQTTLTFEPDQGASANGTFSTKYLMRGMRVSADPTKTGSAITRAFSGTVLSFNHAANTAIFTGDASDLADADYIFLGSKEVPSKGRSVNGLQNIVSATGTFLGINRATAGNEYWQSYVDTSFGGADWESGIQLAGDTVHNNFGGETGILLMSMGVWRAAANKLRMERQFVSAAETGKYKGGVSMLMYEGMGDGPIPILKDRDVPKGTIYGLNLDDFFRATLADEGWISEHGEGSPFQREPGFRIWSALYGWMGEIFCAAPGRQWAITGITEA
jgi:hypothetical protein